MLYINAVNTSRTVSYTHLDVYKRQGQNNHVNRNILIKYILRKKNEAEVPHVTVTQGLSDTTT